MLEKNRRIAYIAIVVIVILAVLGAGYLTFFYNPECKNFECWQKYMSRCSRATFINEEPEASWGYTIKGMSNKQCHITVKLLQAKQGELGISKIIGEEMDCYYPKGTATYVEKDLSKCHGLLKEELQQIIINKLHAYILENLGEFDKALGRV
jgi:hypothetical protein